MDKATVLRSEVECRDATGKRVGSSPIMMGWCNNLLVQDCYVHHAIGGMPTMFGSSSGQFTRVRSEYNGSGGSGGVASYDPKQPVGYDQGSVGGHVGGGSATDSLKLYITSPTFDGGSKPGYFDCQIQRTYAGSSRKMLTSDLHVNDASGKALPFYVRN